MPAKSEKEAHLMRAAAHGANFQKAKDIRASMSPSQIRDFEHTSGHVEHAQHATHARAMRRHLASIRTSRHGHRG